MPRLQPFLDRQVKSLSGERQTAMPQCKAILYADPSRKKKIVCKDYALKGERCGEFQVLRMFYVVGIYKQGQCATFFTKEVFQKWIDPQGRTTILSLPRHGMSIYIDSWVWTAKLEVRNENVAHTVIPQYTLAKMSLIPALKRNGYKGDSHGIPPTILFPLLLGNPKFETLAKAEQWELARQFSKSRSSLEFLWPSIRIAIRNRYRVKDASLWCDMVNALHLLGKDTRNPRWICPENLNEMHDHWIKALNAKRQKDRARRIREAEQERERRYIEDKKRLQQDEKAYQENKERFFDIELKDGDITIQPLKSISDFIEESAALRHCCFACKYYAKEKSLILRAVVDGAPTETIEIDLDSLQIVQCRAKHNGISDHHDRILKLMSDNIHEVAKRPTA
ncbi:MAG: PcfJ domain-containing protein [Bacteroidales bacterium]|nr:PcfJ domain-containing protein [Bacteroidales bacterium]